MSAAPWDRVEDTPDDRAQRRLGGSIALLDSEVEVDESHFGLRFENRRRARRRELRKLGRELSGHGARRLKQVVFGIY
jgi:hypothetical protein